jgi:hypothetical protein
MGKGHDSYRILRFCFLLPVSCLIVVVFIINVHVLIDLNYETIQCDTGPDATHGTHRRAAGEVSRSGSSRWRQDPFDEPSSDVYKFLKSTISFYVDTDDTLQRAGQFFVRTTYDPTASFLATTTSREVAEYSPASSKNCQCDLISVDCLDSIACIPTNKEHVYALVLLGIETRRSLKKAASYHGFVDGSDGNPIGKNLQYATISAWNSWRERGILPKFHGPGDSSVFVDPSRYPYCRELNQSGMSCFFGTVYGHEHSVGAEIENNAVQWIEAKHNSTKMATKERLQIRQMMGELVQEQVPRTVRHSRSPLSPLGYLMLFSHLCRILFNRRPFLDKIFQAHLTTLETRPGLSASSEHGAFALSLHMRRGDSCSESNPRKYESEASALDSPAQVTAVRKCYKTQVYMDAVRRVRQLVPDDRPIHVYLSTDDVGDVMEEIQERHADVYQSIHWWSFLNYSRAHFQYGKDLVIEDAKNKERPILGETAVSDLWLLSHGEAFVAHLGSRFGKVSWLLATSRFSRFIPFFSVDGHSESVCMSVPLLISSTVWKR